MNEKELFLSYIAGLFDGEGCIRVHNTSECASITSCYPHHLHEIRRWFGFGRISKVSATKPNHRTAWRYELWGRDARRFITEIRPYLREKAYQADIMLMIRALPKKSLTRSWALSELKRAKRIHYDE